MDFKKINNKLNQNIEEETSFINSVSTVKYFVVFVPVLFVVFSVFRMIIEGLASYNWKYVLIEAVLFSVFLRIFHLVRKKWKDAWKK